MQQSPDLFEVRTLVALADTGSFVAAGHALGRDPTVLSRRLSALEARLGVRLVERTTRRVTFTEAGCNYLARMRPLLRELDAADREVASFATGEPRGHLRVSLPATFARLWLAPLVVGFAKAHPKITLQAHYSNRLVDLIGEGYDLAVRLAELPDSRMIARKIGGRRRLVCAAPDYLKRHKPIRTPKDVLSHDCLIFTGRSDPYRWQFRRPEGEETITVKGRIASDDADVLVEAAIAGLGLFYTTDWHVGPALSSGLLVEVLCSWTVIDQGAIYIVTPANEGVPTKTRAFSKWMARGLASPPWQAPNSRRTP